ncbi:hypothetical protein [uncultured Fretibacterium sp.]|uniref:hypothetical protein n=1 Tax=uncultured Fretibacterium sp. TaxID=1678694 RepID=UPI002633C0B4|nr:hypothetical protein [uncultured Fretibacterium sp.]
MALFVNMLKSDDHNPNTYNLRFAYLKKFFNWCLSEGLLSCAHLLAELLRLPNRRTFTGLRDYALMLFSLDCGARPGESLQLRARDFNLSGLLVTIPAPAAKTRQPRTYLNRSRLDFGYPIGQGEQGPSSNRRQNDDT